MEAKSVNRTSTNKDGKTTWSLREEYDNDESKELTVRECENGFIVRLCHHYKEQRKGGDGYDYKWDEKEFISPTNPLDETKLKKEEKKQTTTKEIADSMVSFMGGMMKNKIMI